MHICNKCFEEEWEATDLPRIRALDITCNASRVQTYRRRNMTHLVIAAPHDTRTWQELAREIRHNHDCTAPVDARDGVAALVVCRDLQRLSPAPHGPLLTTKAVELNYNPPPSPPPPRTAMSTPRKGESELHTATTAANRRQRRDCTVRNARSNQRCPQPTPRELLGDRREGQSR
jgi:hypothetical protein